MKNTKKHGIKILPPDINESGADFTVSGNSVRFGLSSIKGVGGVFADEIEKRRAKEIRVVYRFLQCYGNGIKQKKQLKIL
ncbi:MAG: hypothetical protein L6V93_06630 [Clostridiales bacterium]|nr:MAG: hypothetical protein L6V93_06630 [Clostridiales bacterium]